MHWYYSADGAAVGPHSADDIENLFATRQLTAETLVRRKGLAEWTPLADTDEFAHLADVGLPPPLPFASGQATFAGAPDEVLVAERVGDYGPGRDRAGDDQQADDDDEPFTLAPPAVAPALAGPWTRYFARSIDLSIIATVLLTLIYWVLPTINPQLLLQIDLIDGRVLFFILLPAALVINAIIITLAGNSLGKAIFAIRAEPIAGSTRFGFGGNLAREFRVWLQGMALGIPVLNFFTMVPAFRAVLRGAPTSYDIGRATVRSYSDNRLRRTLAMLFALALYVGFAALNVMDRAAIQSLERPISWTNPTTQLATTIPAGWQYEPATGADGAPLHGFANVATGRAAFLGLETADNMDMATYAAALSQGMSRTITLGDWSMSNLPGVWTASGQLKSNSAPATVYAAQAGSQFWRIVYVDQFSTTPRVIAEPEMTAALFRSAGVGTAQ